MEMRFYVCPVCGNIAVSFDRFLMCDECGYEDVTEITDEQDEQFKQELENMPYEEYQKYIVREPGADPDASDKVTALCEYRRQKFVFNSPLFDKAKYNARVRHNVEYLNKRNREKSGIPEVTCPTCGSTNTKKISAGSKAVSVGLFGIFSQKVRHQFHCNSCGYEW